MTDTYITPDKSARECKYGWFDSWDWLVNRALACAGTPKIELAPGEIALDSHVHTLFSHCSITQPEALIRWADRIGLGAICVMDHNNVSGSLDAVCCADYLKGLGAISQEFFVIPGTEINSTVGHIGALFVQEDITMSLTPADTVKAIHDAGGIAVAVHPYHSTGIGDAVFDAPFDAVEVEPGSVFGAQLVAKNIALKDDPRLAGVAKLGASDGHYVRAVAHCYTVLKPDQMTPEGIRQALLSGESVPKSSAPCRKMRRMLGGIGKLK